MRSGLAGWSTATRGALVALVALAGCTAEEPVGWSQQPLDAFCTAAVEGVGDVDVETDYLPHVVNCENGAAGFEALKAQAVSARSYLYYKLARGGTITDGTGDQVYTCGREPSADHYRAVEETSGEVLQYMGTQVAAFYVAGARQVAPDCRGGTDDPTNTERYVTYNEGLSGDGITQTTLGFVDPSNHANRGCKSQNGAHCLAGMGWRYDDILRFYYGEDIELVRAEGACVTTPETDGGTPPVDGGTTLTDAGGTTTDAGVAPTPDASSSGGDGGGAVVGVTGSATLRGGCSATGSGGGSAPWGLAVIVLLWLSRRPRFGSGGSRRM